MPTYKITITVDPADEQRFVELITTVMLFGRVESSGSVKYPELKGLSFEPDPEYVDPVLATEAEEVREFIRPKLQAFAQKHGVRVAKDLLRDCGAEGIKTASMEALAQLRHYFTTKYKGGIDGDSNKV